jgi:hypothetical protein
VKRALRKFVTKVFYPPFLLKSINLRSITFKKLRNFAFYILGNSVSLTTVRSSRYKECVCGLSLARIAVLNPAKGMEVCLLCGGSLFSGKRVCDEALTHPEQSCSCCRVIQKSVLFCITDCFSFLVFIKLFSTNRHRVARVDWWTIHRSMYSLTDCQYCAVS